VKIPGVELSAGEQNIVFCSADLVLSCKVTFLTIPNVEFRN